MINFIMEYEIKAEEDENFKVNPEKDIEKKVESGPTPTSLKVDERPQPTLENPKGHSWFNGTSWGLK